MELECAIWRSPLPHWFLSDILFWEEREVGEGVGTGGKLSIVSSASTLTIKNTDLYIRGKFEHHMSVWLCVIMHKKTLGDAENYIWMNPIR